jgi:[protein-PII] uridylyltransferase
VDIFKVTGPPDPNDPDRTWAKVRKDLKETFSGKLSLHDRLSQKAAPSILSSHQVSTRPPDVIVDNHSSDFFTLIEVFADDRVGLLYEITHTLFRLGLDIRIAKIATKGDQVADTFYIRDTEGQKLEDKKKVEAIREALLNQLGRIET